MIRIPPQTLNPEPSFTFPAISRTFVRSMADKWIDGAALAAKMRQDVTAGVAAARPRRGAAMHLTAILVGSTSAGELYAQRQRQACQAVGIQYELRTVPAEASQKDVATLIHSLNHDPSITGIMLHLPVPRTFNATDLQYQIDPVKDVEGVNPANIGYVVYGHTLIAPCTALAVIELIKSTDIPLHGAEAVVVGARKCATASRSRFCSPSRWQRLLSAISRPAIWRPTRHTFDEFWWSRSASPFADRRPTIWGRSRLPW